VTSVIGLIAMPECRCWTKRCKLMEHQQCQTELFIGIPAFRHSGIHASMHVHCPGPCRKTESVLRVHVHAACPCPYGMPCPCCMFMSTLHSMLVLHSMSMLHVHVYVHVHVCRNARMPDCPASDQSGTRLKKTNDAGTGPVPD
jgi:hypothetical protein